MQRNPLIMIILIVLVLVLGVIGLIIDRQGSNRSDPNANKSIDSSTLTSPLANATDSLTVNYGGDAEPNIDAVQQRFRLFAAESIGIDPALRNDIEIIVPGLLARIVIPTYTPTFMQVNPETISCTAIVNCTMDLYIDSPEMLFKLTTSYVDGRPYFTLAQKPWEGL